MPSFLKQLLACALVLVSAMPAIAENLVSVKNDALPALVAKPSALFVASGQPVVTQSGQQWRLNESRQAWVPKPWGGHALGAIQTTAEPLLLVETVEGRGIDHLQPYAEAAGSAKQILPALPIRFLQAQGAVVGSMIYLAGLAADGSAHWLSIDSTTPDAAWKILPVWASQASRITSVVAQDKALFVTSGQSAGQADKLWRWTATDGWIDQGQLPGPVADGAARALGQAHLLFLVNQGAGSQLLTYHTITKSFANQGPDCAGAARRGLGQWPDLGSRRVSKRYG